MSNVGFATLDVIPSFRGLQGQLERGTNAPMAAAGKSSGKKFGDAAGKEAGTSFRSRMTNSLRGFAPLAGVAAGAGITALFSDAISKASDLSESGSKVNVVFGDAADEVQAFASNSAKAFGQSQAQALEATGTFGNLLRAVGLTEDESAKLSTAMVGLASDLASFNNTSVDDALEALRSGLVGETEPLKRFGVNLNEARLKQEAMNQGLSDGKGVLDANAKAQAAYALIMKDTALAQGDFERTSGGLANQQRILSAQWTEMQAAVGQKLLPVVTDFVTFVNDDAVPALGAVGGVVVDAAQAFGSLPGPVKAATASLVAFRIAQSAGITSGLSAGARSASSAFDTIRLRAMLARDEYVKLNRGTLELNGNFGKVTPGINRFSSSLGAVRAGAAGAGTALRTGLGGAMSLLGGPWGVALAAGTLAVTHFWQEHQRAKAEVDAFVATLDAETGAFTEQSRAAAAKRLLDAGVLEDAKALGIQLSVVTDAALGQGDAFKTLIAQLEQMREAGTSLTGQGEGLTPMARNAQELHDALIDANGVVRTSQREFSLMAEATDAVAEATGTAATDAGRAAVATANYATSIDGAREALQKMLDKENQRHENSLRDRRDRLALLDQLAAAKKEAREGKITLDENTKAGRENMNALLDLADQWNNSSGKVKNARGAYQEMRTQFIKVAEQMGATRSEARKMAEQFLQLPKRKAIQVETPGMQKALADVKRLNDLAAQKATLTLNVERRRSGLREVFATGGKVGGSGTGDTRNIWADPREWVIQPKAVAHYGDSFMQALNNMQISKRGMANGGPVAPTPRPTVQGGNNFNGPITVVADDPDQFLRALQRRVGRRAIGGIPIGGAR